jgi:DNA-binding transcriptional regulator YiaG
LDRLRSWVYDELDDAPSRKTAPRTSTDARKTAPRPAAEARKNAVQPAAPRSVPTPRPYGARDVQQMRERLGMSQQQFARLLHVSIKTVQSWEQGVRVPSQAAERLLQFIEQPDLLAEVVRPAR